MAKKKSSSGSRSSTSNSSGSLRGGSWSGGSWSGGSWSGGSWSGGSWSGGSAGSSGTGSGPRRSMRIRSVPFKVPFPSLGQRKGATQVIQQAASVHKPPRFSWVIEGLLAGHGRPTKPGHIRYLCQHGFSYLVTLTMNKPVTVRDYPGEGLEWVHLPIQDETPPSLKQIQQFVSVVDKAKDQGVAVSVHCAWGRGRTGTMLACYMAKHDKLSADDAIKAIRTLRPGSIDTDGQIQAIQQYTQLLKQ